MAAGKQWCCQTLGYFLPLSIPLALHVVSPICSRVLGETDAALPVVSCMTYVWIKRRFKDFSVGIDQMQADPQAKVTALISEMSDYLINEDSARDLKTCWLYISHLPSQHLTDL